MVSENYVWFGNPVYPFVTGELAQFGQSGNRYFNEQDHQKLEQHFEEVRQSDPLLVASLDQELSECSRRKTKQTPAPDLGILHSARYVFDG
jgi:hypothetical protein